MKYWISTTFYLWKNIWSHWCESPLSGFSKILLTFLLSFLALVLIGALRQTESLLEQKLLQSDILTAKLNINSFSSPGPVALENSLYREAFLKNIIESDQAEFFRRPYLSAKDSQETILPVITTYGKPNFWKDEWGDYGEPNCYLFTRKGASPKLNFTLKTHTVEPVLIQMPDELSKTVSEKHLVFMPYDMSHLALLEGFGEYMVFQATSLEHLKSTIVKIEAYFEAENIRYSIVSSLKILEELQQFKDVLKYVRYGLVVLLVIIISIVLGNQAVLEFREQQYHYGLLRSFGVSYFQIILNDLLEKILLASIGFCSAYYLIPLLESYTKRYTPQIGKLNFIILHEDLFFVGGGVLLGVLISWLFLAFTSRKPVGLVLS